MRVRLCCMMLGALLGLSERLFAGDVILVEHGVSPYQIVVAEGKPKNLQAHITATGYHLQDVLKEAYGVTLPVVMEGKFKSGVPGIYVGDSRFARSHGVDVTALKNWEGRIKVVGKDLILAGHDFAMFDCKYYYPCVLGSVRATTMFLRKHVGVSYLLPGKNGRQVPTGKRLVLRDDLDEVHGVPYQYCRSRPQEMFYAIANGLISSTTTWLYGGHSYYSAVPSKTYGKTHPEYFIQVGDGRSSSGNHLCLSNPEVQELIYQEMLRKLDAGYEMVELAQTDGYQHCQCETCKNLFGVTDPAEQLWILHRKLAERLYRERPTKKVLIISYNPTTEPPKTFTAFPPNTAIQLCRNAEEDFQAWSKVTVPQGFSVYIYNWGAYHVTGLSSPKRTMAYLEDQLRRFKRHNVRSIFLCGFGELYGLEGPQYYALYRLMEDSSRSGAAILAEFCHRAYGEAEVPMLNFFQAIDRRLEVDPLNYEAHGDLLQAGVICQVWDPGTLELLERLLSTAESIARSAKVKARLNLVRGEFDFLRSTVRALTFYNTYRLQPNWSNFGQLEEAIKERLTVINRFFGPQAGCKATAPQGWREIWPYFSYTSRNDAISNGWFRGAIGAPFNWNFALLREKKVLPCSSLPQIRVPRVNSIPEGFDFEAGGWRAAQWNEMQGIQLAEPTVPTRFKVVQDGKALHIAFSGKNLGDQTYQSKGKDGGCWGQDCLEVLLDPFGLRSRHYHFIVNAIDNSTYDAREGFGADPLDPNLHKADPGWNGVWTYRYRLDKDRWLAVMSIDFSNFPVPAPRKGTIWAANFGREEFHVGVHFPELLLWAPNPEARDFHDRGKFGTLVFD